MEFYKILIRDIKKSLLKTKFDSESPIDIDKTVDCDDSLDVFIEEIKSAEIVYDRATDRLLFYQGYLEFDGKEEECEIDLKSPNPDYIEQLKTKITNLASKKYHIRPTKNRAFDLLGDDDENN